MSLQKLAISRISNPCLFYSSPINVVSLRTKLGSWWQRSCERNHLFSCIVKLLKMHSFGSEMGVFDVSLIALDKLHGLHSNLSRYFIPLMLPRSHASTRRCLARDLCILVACQKYKSRSVARWVNLFQALQHLQLTRARFGPFAYTFGQPKPI